MVDSCCCPHEIWAEIKNRPEYQISSCGRLRRHGVLMRGAINKAGYRTYSLNNHPHLAHRIVARAFLKNPDNKRTVNHRDLNKINNHTTNLEWAAHKENANHGRDHLGNYNAVGERSSGAILTENQALEILRLRGGEETTRDIGRRYGVTHVAVVNIWNRKTWAHLDDSGVPAARRLKPKVDAKTGRFTPATGK